MKTIAKFLSASALSLCPFLVHAQESPANQNTGIFEPYKRTLQKETQNNLLFSEEEQASQKQWANSLVLKKEHPVAKLFKPQAIVFQKISHLMDFYFVDDIPNVLNAPSPLMSFLLYNNPLDIEPHHPKHKQQIRIADLSKDYLEDDFMSKLKIDFLRIRKREFSSFENNKELSVAEKEANLDNFFLDFKVEGTVFSEDVSAKANILKGKIPIKFMKFNATFDNNLEEKLEFLLHKPSLTKQKVQQLLTIERELGDLYFSETLNNSPPEKYSWMVRSTWYHDKLSNSFDYHAGKYFGNVGFSVPKDIDNIEGIFLHIGKQKTALKINWNNNDYNLGLSRQYGNKVFYLNLDDPVEPHDRDIFVGMKIRF